MRDSWRDFLDLWREAGLIDPAAAARIQEFQERQPVQSPRAWAVWVTLVLGGIALGAGVFLFVASHWDGMAPESRMALVVAMVAGFHGAGIAFRRSEAFRTLFHSLGTLSVGAAIALTAQIFNIEEHWAAGTLLWALAAAIGWYLLREWPQGLMLALLGPAWLAGEWLKLATPVRGWEGEVVVLFVFLLALVYISARVADGVLQMALHIAGTVAVFPAFLALSLEPIRDAGRWTGFREAAWAVALLLPVIIAWRLGIRPWWVAAAMAVWAACLALLRDGPALARHGWDAAGCAVYVSWAVRTGSVLRVNLGVIGFAITVLMFYFSSVMDKLGRSLSLITLGVLLLGGGWALDRWRRKLIATITENRP